MRLTFSVLWFDDTEDFFDSLDMHPLKETIRSWGFEPKLQFVSDPDEFISYEPYKDYDLIIVDYNLEAFNEHGQKFIKKIRSHDVYTEIIFYSANPASELWDAVRELELEGVFVSNRGSILTKIERVGKQSVRKILDIENMRGIVMAEVGDIDFLLDSIIENGIETLDEAEKDNVFQGFHNRYSCQIDRSSSILKGFKDAPTVEGLLSLCSDSYKKWNVVRSIAKRSNVVNLNDIGDYKTDIISPRNHLAHGKPELNEQGAYVFKHAKNEFVFDDQSSKELRQKISGYKVSFNKIKSTLDNRVTKIRF